MRILVCSDTHFGFASDSPREDDFYKIIDHVSELVKKNKYDLLIHAGDLFNVVKPSNRAILNACRFVRTASEEVKLSVYCGGNHCKPRMASVVHPIDLIQLHYLHDNVSMHHTAGYDVVGNVVVFSLPYQFTTAAYESDIKKFMEVCDEIDDGAFGSDLKKILVTHAVYPDMSFVKAIPNIRMVDALPASIYKLAERMDLTINGHVHIPCHDMEHNILFTGATEQVSFGEAGLRFVYDVTIDDKVNVFPIKLPVRPMVQIDVDCEGVVDVEKIYTMCKLYDSISDDAFVKVVLSNLDKNIAVGIDKSAIKCLYPNIAHMSIQMKTKTSEVMSFEVKHNLNDISSLWDEWSLQLNDPDTQMLGRQIIQETM